MPQEWIEFYVWSCCQCQDGPLGEAVTHCFNTSCSSFIGEPHKKCDSCPVQRNFKHKRDWVSSLPRLTSGPETVIFGGAFPRPTQPTRWNDAAIVASDDSDFSSDVHPAIVHSVLGIFSQCLVKSLDTPVTSTMWSYRIIASRLEWALPDLLRNFGLELEYGKQAREFAIMGLLIRKRRREIVEAVSDMIDVHFRIISDRDGTSTTETRSEGRDAKDEGPFFDPNFLGRRAFEWTSPGRPVVATRDPRSNKDLAVLLDKTLAEPDGDHMTREDLERLNLRLMLGSPAFKRLCSRANSRLRLSYLDAECLNHVRDEARVLSRQFGGWGASLFPQSAIEVVGWHPGDFIGEQGYTSGPGSLAKALTITGSTSECQLLSCLDYVRQVWPITGETVIETVIEACDKEGVTNRKLLQDGTEIQIASRDRPFKIECTGLPGTIIEVFEILAWAGAALRQASIPSGVEYSVPHLKYLEAVSDADKSHTFRLSYHTESIPQVESTTDWDCWHGIFANPVIAKGFPVLYRTGQVDTSIPGLELSLEGMATLIGAPKLTIFQQNVMFKGFNAAISPIDDDGEYIYWHFYINPDGSRMTYSDPRLHPDQDNPVRLTWDELKTRRHLLGWTPKVSHNIGSPLVNYNIGWSSPEYVGPGCALEKVAISGSTGFLSLGAEFSLGRKDKSPSIKRGMDAYFDTLNSLLSSYVVFYDVSDQRAWLTNAMHALLHLVRASLKHDSESEFAGEHMLKSLSELEEDVDPASPKAGIRFLSNPSNLEKLLFPNPDDLRTEETKTTRPGPSAALSAEVFTAEIRTSTGVRLKDRIQQIIYVLEQTIDHQANVHSFAAPGVPLKLTPRETLEGYRFMDIAARTARALTPRMVKLTTYNGAGKSWVDFTRAIRAVTLFGEGFGELLSPQQASVAQTTDNNICPNWNRLPVGKDYLAVSTYDLARILKQEGSMSEYPLMKLAPGIFWQKLDTVFKECACREHKQTVMASFPLGGHPKSCDRVQTLLPPSFLPRKKQQQPAPDPVLVTGGAVVFGRSERFPLKWPNRGEPKKDNASADPPTTDGPTSTAPTPGLMDSMNWLSLSNIVASPSSSASSPGATNTATTPSLSSISTRLTDDAASISTTTTSPRTRKRQRLWNIAQSLTGS